MRLATVLPIPTLLRARGIDPTELLASVGLDSAAFNDADNQMPFRTGGLLLQRCAEITACPHFGLLVGQQSDIESLGRVGALMRHSPTVDAALRSLILHLHLQNRGGIPTRTVDGEHASMGYLIYQRDMQGTAQVSDLVAAVSYNMLRSLCGNRWRPTVVTFSHARPRDVKPYSRFFKAPLEFDADATELRFDKAWLDRPLRGTDAALYALLLRTLSAESVQLTDLVEQVRVALRTMIPTGRATEQSIAARAGRTVAYAASSAGVAGHQFSQPRDGDALRNRAPAPHRHPHGDHRDRGRARVCRRQRIHARVQALDESVARCVARACTVDRKRLRSRGRFLQTRRCAKLGAGHRREEAR